jgi:hypothetical protein
MRVVEVVRPLPRGSATVPAAPAPSAAGPSRLDGGEPPEARRGQGAPR